MAWIITNSSMLGAQPIDEVRTVAAHPFGTITTAYDSENGAGEFIYLAGVASTAATDWVTYNAKDGSTVRLARDAIGPVAVAVSATGAGEYGWYQIGGKARGNCASNFADNGNVYATTTPGRVDDAVSAGDRVKRAKGASAEVANVADFEIDRPFMDDGLAA